MRKQPQLFESLGMYEDAQTRATVSAATRRARTPFRRRRAWKRPPNSSSSRRATIEDAAQKFARRGDGRWVNAALEAGDVPDGDPLAGAAAARMAKTGTTLNQARCTPTPTNWPQDGQKEAAATEFYSLGDVSGRGRRAATRWNMPWRWSEQRGLTCNPPSDSFEAAGRLSATPRPNRRTRAAMTLPQKAMEAGTSFRMRWSAFPALGDYARRRPNRRQRCRYALAQAGVWTQGEYDGRDGAATRRAARIWTRRTALMQVQGTHRAAALV